MRHPVMMNKFFLFLFCMVPAVLAAQVQPVLTLDDAIQLGLKNNYDILIATQSDEIQANNVYPGNAGMLPFISLNGSATKSWDNTKLEYSNGESVDQKNAAASDLNAYAALDWTLFDGVKMFATYNQLKAIRRQSSETLKDQLQQSVFRVMTSYFDVWYQEALLELQQVSDSISNERLKVAQQRFEVGLGSKLEFLQSQVDHNADRSALMKQQVALSASKHRLNELLARDVNTPFTVDKQLLQPLAMPLDTIQQKVFATNPALLAADEQRQVASLEIRKQQGNYYPRIGLTGLYNFTKSSSEAGFVQSNQTYGPAVGLAASWNIFNGNIIRKDVENSKIDAFISGLEYSKIKIDLAQQTATAYDIYRNNLALQQLEVDNQKASKENLDLSVQKYNIGGISGLDFQNAKESFTDSQTRFFTAFYNTQISQLALLQLMGELVK
jgi:outer membrane protein